MNFSPACYSDMLLSIHGLRDQMFHMIRIIAVPWLTSLAMASAKAHQRERRSHESDTAIESSPSQPRW